MVSTVSCMRYRGNVALGTPALHLSLITEGFFGNLRRHYYVGLLQPDEEVPGAGYEVVYVPFFRDCITLCVKLTICRNPPV